MSIGIGIIGTGGIARAQHHGDPQDQGGCAGAQQDRVAAPAGGQAGVLGVGVGPVDAGVSDSPQPCSIGGGHRYDPPNTPRLLGGALTSTTDKRLSAEERRKVREQLMDIAKSIPALAIFALPGGGILLPVLIKVLPFNILPSAFAEETPSS